MRKYFQVLTTALFMVSCVQTKQAGVQASLKNWDRAVISFVKDVDQGKF